MKSYLRSLTLILFIISINLALFIPSVFAQYFTITKFHSDITIQRNSSFIVRETIDVDFHKPRHGIYREIPFKYRDEFGKTIITPTKILSVTDGTGNVWKYQVKKRGHVINIRIGHPKRFVSGKQTYIITYEVENAILFFDDHDELYWNVTGNYWRAPILEASADVNLSTKERITKIWASCYTGSYGSSEKECNYESHEDGVRFTTTKGLSPGEGLTIAFGWDKGFVSPPSNWKKFLWTIDIGENWIFLFPIISFLYMFNQWYRKGRDPKVRESLMVMYEPPKYENIPLTPAEVGTLIDEKLDPRDITSTIVGLSVKGYIQIEEFKTEGLIFDKSDYYLIKLKEPDNALNLFEIELMNSLFSSEQNRLTVSSLKNKFYKNMNLLKKTLYEELVRKGNFLVSPEKIRNIYFLLGILIIGIGGFILSFFPPYSLGRGFISSALTGLPLILFGRYMPSKTRRGATAKIEILGFLEFMSRAEKDRLERMGDKDLFSKFLPYAIALDVVDNWARAFEGIYQEPPRWYVSPAGFRTFNPYVFSHSLNSMTQSLGSAMFSAPRGSGGRGGGIGGGGFSGGGFGGGGGGSW